MQTTALDYCCLNTEATLSELLADSPSTIVGLMVQLSRLRDLRMRSALTQAELAERAGVARTTVIRLEHGGPNVNPSTVRKLARALRVKPAELMDDYPE